MSSRSRILASLVILVVSVSIADAQPVVPPASGDSDTAAQTETYEEAVTHAENAFAFGDFSTVITTLDPWLYPQPSADIDPGDTADGYAWLGASAWFTDDRTAAADYFKVGLHIHPDMRLDPLVFPPSLLKFFEDIRKELKLDERTEPSQESGTVYIESRVTTHPVWVSVLPFGYGMFVNDEPAWGAVYALTEGTLLAVSSSLFWVNYAKRVPSDDLARPWGYADPENAQRRRTAHIATGAALLGIIVINMIHGALIHNKAGEVQYRTLDAPPSSFDNFNTEQRSDRRVRRWNVRIGPFSAD